jgi:low temperature requirement protein LtrA
MTEAAAVEKRVGWAELFFDLVFVYAVTEVSALLADDHSWTGLLRALVVFVPVYWLWVGTAFQTNQRDVSLPGLRMLVFAVALAAIFMALALPEAYDDLGLLFAFGYWAGRLLLGAGLIRPSAWAGGPPINPYLVSMLVTGPLLVVGALIHGDARLVIWAVAALIDLASPAVLRARLSGMHFDAPHLAERFGLFVLIALGESVVSIGVSAGHLTIGVGFAVAAAFALSCGLWWVYFHFSADAVRHALATAQVQLDITRSVLSYGHLSFVAAIILVAVGMHEAVAHPGHPLGWAATGLLCGGCALYLATFGYTRWAMFRLVSWTRLTAAVVVVLLLPLTVFLPALATLLVLAAAVAVLNGVEFVQNSRLGWRALLARRETNGRESEGRESEGRESEGQPS